MGVSTFRFRANSNVSTYRHQAESWAWSLCCRHFVLLHSTKNYLRIVSYISAITYRKQFLLLRWSGPYYVGRLSPLHRESSGCGWRRRPPHTKSSCEYIDSCQWVGLQFLSILDLDVGLRTCHRKQLSSLRNVTQTLEFDGVFWKT
jgi:hypothetical protein